MYLNRWHLKKAQSILEQSGIIGYATEGLFGFGCLADDETALLRLRKLKQREGNKAFILIGDCIDRFSKFVALTPKQRETIEKGSEHPTTWLVPFSRDISPLIVGNFNKVAIRITNHPQVCALTKQLQQPITSTSANWAGGSPCKTDIATKLKFLHHLDYVLPGATLGYTQASHIIDIVSGQRIR